MPDWTDAAWYALETEEQQRLLSEDQAYFDWLDSLNTQGQAHESLGHDRIEISRKG